MVNGLCVDLYIRWEILNSSVEVILKTGFMIYEVFLFVFFVVPAISDHGCFHLVSRSVESFLSFSDATRQQRIKKFMCQNHQNLRRNHEAQNNVGLLTNFTSSNKVKLDDSNRI